MDLNEALDDARQALKDLDDATSISQESDAAERLAEAFLVLDEDWSAWDRAEIWADGYVAGDADARAVNKGWPEQTRNPYRRNDRK